MKKTRLAITFFIIIWCFTGCANSSDKYAQIDIPYQLKDISMYDTDKGWALTTENEILFTDNGIENFTPVRKFDGISVAGDYFMDVCFVDEKNVYAAYFSENGDLMVEYTRDGGKNWQQTPVKWEDDSGDRILEAGGSAYINFSDTENGYLLYCSTPAAGLMTKLLFCTTNGGESFSYERELSEISGYPQGIAPSNGKYYIAVTPRAEEHYLYVRGENTGKWTSEEIIPLPKGIRYIDGFSPVFDMKDKRNGIMVLKAVGDDIRYLLFVTDDEGESWVQKGELSLDSVKNYSCIDGKHFYFINDTGNLYGYL